MAYIRDRRSVGVIAAAVRSKKTKQNSFSRIRFTTATSATREKCMRASIRRLSPKSFLTKCKKVLALRGKAQKLKKSPQALCGLLKCGECGCSITAEVQTKKSGRSYIYYRCTKKRGACSQPFVREEMLDTQLSELLSKFHLPREWAEELDRMATKDEANTSQTTAASVQVMRAKIAELDGKIARLTDLFVEQDIERDEYLSRKRSLMSEKKSLQERSLLLERNAAAWLEPMRNGINEASMLDEIAKSKDLPSKKIPLQKIFGSNLTLHAREARGMPANHWFSIAAATENQSKTDLVSCLVPREGLEPSRPCDHMILSHGRLPIPPSRLRIYNTLAMLKKQKVLVIVGATSSGKSALAIELAKKFDGEVISADSRQVYRGLNIGTGKITKREMNGVPHHLLDVVSPKRKFSADDYVRRARTVIEDISKRGKIPIVAGGAGGPILSHRRA